MFDGCSVRAHSADLTSAIWLDMPTVKTSTICFDMFMYTSPFIGELPRQNVPTNIKRKQVFFALSRRSTDGQFWAGGGVFSLVTFFDQSDASETDV